MRSTSVAFQLLQEKHRSGQLQPNGQLRRHRLLQFHGQLHCHGHLRRCHGQQDLQRLVNPVLQLSIRLQALLDGIRRRLVHGHHHGADRLDLPHRQVPGGEVRVAYKTSGQISSSNQSVFRDPVVDEFSNLGPARQ